jgi:hypothetical protein
MLSFYMEVLTFVDRFSALRFTAAGASPAARRIRFLPMNQYACWPITFGMKLVTFHISQDVLKMQSLAVAVRSHLRRQTVESNCTNEPCYLDRAAARRWFFFFVGWDLSPLRSLFQVP